MKPLQWRAWENQAMTLVASTGRQKQANATANGNNNNKRVKTKILIKVVGGEAPEG